MIKKWGKYTWEEWKDGNKEDHQSFHGVRSHLEVYK